MMFPRDRRRWAPAAARRAIVARLDVTLVLRRGALAHCYFNISSRCAVVITTRALELPRRRNPLNIGLEGWNTFGSAWLSADLAHFFFERMAPATRREVDRRRQSVLRAAAAGAGDWDACVAETRATRGRFWRRIDGHLLGASGAAKGAVRRQHDRPRHRRRVPRRLRVALGFECRTASSSAASSSRRRS